MEAGENKNRVEAWNELLATTPEMQELIATHRELEGSMSPVELDAALLERMTALGVSFRSVLRVMHPTTNFETPLYLDLAALAYVIEANTGMRTVGDVADWVNEVGRWDEQFLDFIRARARGEDTSAFGAFGGIVQPYTAFENTEEPLPLVVAIANPKTHMDEHLGEYRRVCADYFAGVPSPTAEYMAFIAKCIRLRDGLDDDGLDESRTLAQVTWLLLEEEYPEIASVVDAKQRRADYGELFEKKYGTVRQALTRGIDHVTETRGSASQE